VVAGRSLITLNIVSHFEVMTASSADGVNRTYLGSEENYRIVRNLQLKNLIIPIVGDFSGPKAVVAVGRYLREHNALVSVFYTSNVEQYLFLEPINLIPKTDWKYFYDNVATLPTDESSLFMRVMGNTLIPRVAGATIGLRTPPRLVPIEQTLEDV